MATLEKRGDTWRAKIRKKGYSTQSRSFRIKAQAEKWVRKTESEMDYGLFVSRAEAERITFKQLMERYRDEVSSKKKGVETETFLINAMIKRSVFKKMLAAVNSGDIAAYRDERLKKVSSDTIRRELTILSHAIDIGIMEWGIYLPANPVKLVRRPPPSKPRERRLNGDEEKKLFKALDKGTRNPWIKPLVQLAIETAMRRGELLGLTWNNINLKTKVAHLPETKNGETRDVPLSPQAIKILKALPRDITGHVFPITKYSLKKAFERARKRAKCEDLRFHDLRHEATSRLFEHGLQLMEVAAITGHKDLAMLKRYTHLRAEDLAQKLR